MRILIAFALENEFSPWRALRKFRRSKWNKADVFQAEVGAAHVNVLLTGVGMLHASLAIAKVALGEAETVECCISAGLAGALQPGYQIGQILAAREVVAGRALPDSDGRSLQCSPPLVSFAEDCGASVADRFYTSDHVISRAEEKQHLGMTADAVEMESFAVLSKARADGVPGIAIRSVSDTVDEDLPLDMNEVFTADGKVSIPRVLGQAAIRPRSIPRMLKLGHNSKRAAESLAAFLDRYIREFSKRASALESNALRERDFPN